MAADADSRDRLVGPTALLICAVAVICTAAVGMLAYWQFNAVLVDNALSELDAAVRESAAIFSAEVAETRRDSRFLAGTPPVAGVPRAIANGGVDPQDGATDAIWRRRLEVIFMELLDAKPRYVELRYVSVNDGWRELVRVNRGPQGAVATAPEHLAEMETFLDFNNEIRFDPSRVYLSRIELREQPPQTAAPTQAGASRPGTPLAPVIHAAVAVRNFAGEPFGMVIVTLDVEPVFERLRRSLGPDETLIVTNHEGDLLEHPNPARRFAFERGERHRIADEFPEFARLVAENPDRRRWAALLGDLRTGRTAVSARRLSFDPEQPDRRALFLVAAPYEALIAEAVAARNFTLAGGAALLLLALAAGLSSMNIIGGPRFNVSAAQPSADSPGKLPLAAAAVLILLIYVLDVNIPLGVATGGLYAVPVLLSLFSSDTRGTLAVATVSSLLTVSAFFLGSESDAAEYVLLVNRGVSIGIIWVTALLGLYMTRTKHALRSLNQNLEKRVRERTESFRAGLQLVRSVFEHVPIGIGRIDHHGHLADTNPAMRELLGFTERQLREQSFAELLHPEETEALDIVRRLDEERETVEFESRFRCADGSYRWLHWVATPVARVGQIYASARDVTASRQARREVESRLEEKEAMLREIHHRVKNNLQIVSSLLSLQSRRSEAGEVAVLRDCQQRIEAMALVHEKLYSSDTMTEVDLADYLSELTLTQLEALGGGPRIEVDLQLQPLTTTLDIAIPIGLIANELITNCRKHAFVGRSTGRVCVALRAHGTSATLEVRDNGVGSDRLRDGSLSGETLGLRLVRILAEQIDASLELSSHEDGASVRLTFEFEREARRAAYG